MNPPLPRLPADPLIRSRYRGCLLGGAVGDSLGAAVEFMSESEIGQRFGPDGVQEPSLAYGRLGAITDDTQLTLFTAEGLMRAFIRERVRGICHPPGVIAYAYLRWLHTQGVSHRAHDECLDGWLITNRELFERRAPGTTCLAALRALKDVGDRAKNDSKGCGSVMRVAPVGMMFASLSAEGSLESMEACFKLACEAAAITHGHPTAQLSSGAFAVMVMGLLVGRTLDESVRTALDLLAGEAGHEESTNAIVSACDLARSRPGDIGAIRMLGEGWIAEEALAIGLYCALSVIGFREGVVLAVNHGGDSDSTGSIAGQLLGAMHGIESVPTGWLKKLELAVVIEAVADDLATVAEWQLDDESPSGEDDFYFARYPGW